jgi:hypothetical protein
MSFAEHISFFLGKRAIFEETQDPKVSQAKNQLETKVGGKLGDPTAEKTSFEAIEFALDLIPLEYLESNKESLGEIFTSMVNKEKIDFVEKFTEEAKAKTDSILTELNKLDRSKDEVKFASYFSTYARISERLLKIYKILTSQEIEGLSEAISVEPEIKNKIAKIISISRDGAIGGFDRFKAQEEAAIAAMANSPEAGSKLNKYQDLVDALGLSQYIKELIAKGSSAVKSEEEPVSIKRKKRISLRLIRAISLAKLPTIANEVVETEGDYYKLFKTLEKRNAAWMDLALENYVIGKDTTRLSEFNTNARNQESPYEEDQLTYLNAARSWALSYIKGKVDGELSEKAETNLVTELNNTALNKEKEIKNYYLSRDFNLGNFGGIQLKPEIRLPLYEKVKLPVTKEDRIKESPLRNILKSLGAVISTVFSAIPDRGDKAVAQAAKARNMAVLGALNSLVKGGVALVGGKQAGRDYDKMTAKVFPNKDKKAVKEDMLSLGDASGATVVNPEAPGQTHQTPDSMVPNNMDIFALAGPGKKKSKKKKKDTSNQVASFSDFMQRD